LHFCNNHSWNSAHLVAPEDDEVFVHVGHDDLRPAVRHRGHRPPSVYTDSTIVESSQNKASLIFFLNLFALRQFFKRIFAPMSKTYCLKVRFGTIINSRLAQSWCLAFLLKNCTSGGVVYVCSGWYRLRLRSCGSWDRILSGFKWLKNHVTWFSF
jgi:hypothetical protein